MVLKLHREKQPDPGVPHEEVGLTSGDLTRRNVEIIARLEETARERHSALDQKIDRITKFCGSIPFIMFHVALFSAWIVCNSTSYLSHFDPWPFHFLALIVGLEAILLSATILITQNREARLSDRRNHLDLQINLLSEQENTMMLVLMRRIARKMEVECDDPEIRLLAQAASPQEMANQIEQSLEPEAGSVADGVEPSESDPRAESDAHGTP